MEGVDAQEPAKNSKPHVESNDQSDIKLKKEASVVANSIANPDSTEVQRQLPLAEDIAHLRFDITMALAYAPRSEWGTKYQEVLRKYPNLQRYREIFDQSFIKAKAANDSLNDLWRRYQPKDEGRRDSLSQEMEVASPETSKQMIEGLFGVRTAGKIKAEKGRTTLRFTVDKKDFQRLRGLEGSEVFIRAIAFINLKNIGFPIIVFRSDIKGPEIISNIMHEQEHAVNSHLQAGYEFLLQAKYPLLPQGPPLISKNINLDSSLVDRVLRGGDSDTRSVKDELLAYFTKIESWSPKVYEHDSLDQVLSEYTQEITELLTDDSENGLYLPKYNKRLLTKVRDKTAYIKNTTRGAIALADLFRVYNRDYKNKDGQINPARMAINVLQQFPLESWPAVVRLITLRHNQLQGINADAQNKE